MKIALLVKNLGNGFFDAANKGAQEAAKELGDVEVIYTGPTQATPEGQIDIVNSLIAQGVNAIAISANDADALVPVLKKAMDRGIAVVSFDSGVSKEGRQMNLLASATDLIGDQCLKMAERPARRQEGQCRHPFGDLDGDQPECLDRGDEGRTPASIPNVNLTKVVYGDDKQDKSYTEAKGLIDSDPEAQGHHRAHHRRHRRRGAVCRGQQVGRQGAGYRPRPALRDDQSRQVGRCAPQFALWNPIDLGYAATTIAYNLATGKEKAVAGGELSMGQALARSSSTTTCRARWRRPSSSTPSNIDEFAKVY